MILLLENAGMLPLPSNAAAWTMIANTFQKIQVYLRPILVAMSTTLDSTQVLEGQLA